MIGKAICEEREQLTNPKEESSCFHLIDRGPSSSEDSNMHTPMSGEELKLLEMSLNEHYSRVITSTVVMMKSVVNGACRVVVSHALIGNGETA